MLNGQSTMKHRILVIGAGIYQIPLIQRAKQLGHQVFATSYLDNDPGLKMVDKGFNTSILDRPGLVKICTDEKITAVVTAASDLGSLSVGYLNDYFGFPGISEQQVRSVTDKGMFVALQEKLGLPGPHSFLLTNKQEFEEALSSIKKWPIIFKPIFASGSRGVQIVENSAQARAAYESASEISAIKQHCVLQTYLKGKEYGGECLVESGKVVFLELTYKFSNSNRVPTGHCVPCSINDNTQKALIKQIEAIVSYLDVMHSAINIDVIIEADNTPMLIDFSFRSGGNLLSQLMSLKFDLEPYERIIEYAIKNNISPIQIKAEKDGVYGAIILASPTASVMTARWKKEIEDAVQHDAFVIELTFDKQSGDKIAAFDQSSNRFGHIIASVDSLSHYSQLLNKIAAIAVDNATIKIH